MIRDLDAFGTRELCVNSRVCESIVGREIAARRTIYEW